MTNDYGQAPGATGAGAATVKPDPFADAPVVDNSFGGPVPAAPAPADEPAATQPVEPAATTPAAASSTSTSPSSYPYRGLSAYAAPAGEVHADDAVPVAVDPQAVPAATAPAAEPEAATSDAAAAATEVAEPEAQAAESPEATAEAASVEAEVAPAEAATEASAEDAQAPAEPASAAAAAPAAPAAEPAAQPTQAAEWLVSLSGGSGHQVSVAAKGDQVEVSVDGASESRAAASISRLTIKGAANYADTLALDLSAAALSLPISFDGGAGSGDTVRGPATDTTWTIDGAGSGSAANLTFAGVENLAGAPDNKDTFVYAPGGSLAGTADGGAGGYDTLVVKGKRGSVKSSPVDRSSGTMRVDGVPIAYAGLEPIEISTGSFELDAPGATLNVTSDGTNVLVSGGSIESHVLSDITGQLKIKARSITVTGVLDLGAADLVIEALATSTAGATLTAEVIVAGSITTTGNVKLSSAVEQTVDLTGQTLSSDLTYALGSTSTTEVRSGGSIDAAALSLSARTTISFTWHGDAPPATVYDKGNFPNGGSVNVSVTNVTHAGITGGAKVSVGSDALSGTDPASLAIEAPDDTTVDVKVTDTSTPTSAAALATAIGDFLTFDRLVASTTLSRDTRAYVEDTPAADPTVDGRRRHADRAPPTPATSRSRSCRTSSAAASNTVTKDDAVAAVDGATLDARRRRALGAHRHGLRGDREGRDQLRHRAPRGRPSPRRRSAHGRRRSSTRATTRQLTALSHNMIQVPGTPFVTITSARAQNTVDRDDRGVDRGLRRHRDGGDLDVLATGNAQIAARDALGLGPREVRHFGNNLIPTKSAKAIAATLAINVILGGVDAHIIGSSVDADDVTVQARTDAGADRRDRGDRAPTRGPARTRSRSRSPSATARSASARRSRSTSSAGTSTERRPRRRSTRSSAPSSAATRDPWLVQAYGRNAG